MTITNSTTKPLPVSQIEGLQTVVPIKVTHPRSSRRISIANPCNTNIHTQRCHVILYYQSAHPEQDSGWVFAGFTKESLGKAMEQHPIIGGRVMPSDDATFLEVVSNDCGVRLLEARMETKLSEFLDQSEREEAEAQLVYWKDVDENNPQFCPLLYIQVTNFQCGGYSIGISCSLLLADPSSITNFLINWSKIHSKIVSENNLQKLHLHYLPKLKSVNFKNKFLSDPIKNRNKSVIFTTQENILNQEAKKELVSVCVKEAENELGAETLKKTCLFSTSSFEEVKMENYIREDLAIKFQNKLARANWEFFGANEISFYGGNKPVCVSDWVYSAPGEVLAILNPSKEGDSSMSIIVSVPC